MLIVHDEYVRAVIDKKGEDNVAVDECTQAGGAFKGTTNAHEAASSRSGIPIMSEVTVAAMKRSASLPRQPLCPSHGHKLSDTWQVGAGSPAAREFVSCSQS